MKLTKTDKIILESYKQSISGLSQYLGNAYELVLHSLEDLEHSVILIINGHYTERTVGSPITDLALSMLEQIRSNPDPENKSISYFATNKQGAPMKSTTIAITGETGRIIGVLCINFYLNTPLSVFLESFNTGTLQKGENNIEIFMDNPESLIRESVSRVRQEVMSEDSITLTNKNKEIIVRLNAQGIFKLKSAVNIVSEMLGISGNTVYMHLRNIKKEV